jgi:murein DD-endopeptidase MepM/ murein hydrolase activator NlpD
MPRSNVQSRLRASSQMWPRVAVLALVGVAVAGCSDSARFDGNPFASNRQAPPQQQQDVTGSIAQRPAYSGRVESQPLPPSAAQSQPTTVAQGSYAQSGYSNGAQGLGAYRPATRNYSDVTGSVSTPRASPPPPPKPAGAWTWDGGSPVTVDYGDTVENIAHKYGVPVAAILETNGISNAAAIKPGQRLVIPRYVTGAAAQAPTHAPTQTSAHAPADESVHIVQPGESLGGIAHRYGVSLVALAKANRIEPYAKVSMGDRLTIPGGRPIAARQAQIQSLAPQLAQPRTVALDKYAAAPQNARIATQEPPAADTAANTAEPAGSVPSFRWPARGRVIAGFGPKSGGGQNDGINLAVPEGTPIKAADDGVVAYAGNELKGYGNLVLIRHANGFVSAYAHASELLVKRGDSIKRGQVIANAGQTGNVTSPQLHFEIRKGSTPVDPTKYLSGA